VSDQDFFFDEEEEAAVKPAPASTAKGAGRPATKSPAPQPRQSTPASSGGFFDQSVSMAVAALMTVIGLLVGVIGGFLIAPDGGTATMSPATSNQPAPALSEDQIQSGDLPQGHPDIGSMTATESETATSN